MSIQIIRILKWRMTIENSNAWQRCAWRGYYIFFIYILLTYYNLDVKVYKVVAGRVYVILDMYEHHIQTCSHTVAFENFYAVLMSTAHRPCALYALHHPVTHPVAALNARGCDAENVKRVRAHSTRESAPNLATLCHFIQTVQCSRLVGNRYNTVVQTVCTPHHRYIYTKYRIGHISRKRCAKVDELFKVFFYI